MAFLKKMRKKLAISVLQRARKKTNPLIVKARRLEEDARDARANAGYANAAKRGMLRGAAVFERLAPNTDFIKEVLRKNPETYRIMRTNDRIAVEKALASLALKEEALKERGKARTLASLALKEEALKERDKARKFRKFLIGKR